MRRMQENLSGFALVEVLMVTAVAALMASMLLPSLQRSREQARHVRWQGYSNNLRTDPRLAAYYTFEFHKQERAGGLELENRAVGDPSDSRYSMAQQDGAIRGAVWMQNGGRWTGKTALEFNGQGAYVHVPDTDALDLSGEGTLEAWIYMDAIVGNAGIIHKGDLKNKQADEAFALRFVGRSGKVRLTIRDESRSRMVDSNARLETGRWHHVAGTWDGSGMRIYINGVLDNSSNSSLVVRNTTGGLNIGAQLAEDASRGSGNFPFDGQICEVAVYNGALSAREIKGHYEMGSM